MLLKIGQSVAQQVARKWLAERATRKRRGQDLSDLLDARFPLRGKRREFDRALLGVEDKVAALLEPSLARAAYNLPDNERTAALDAVADTLDHADLSDSALFATDLSPATVAESVRRQFPLNQVGLSEQAITFYRVALEQTCVVLVHMVRELPEFSAASAVEILVRQTSNLAKLDELLARVPVPDLDAPSGTSLDERFRRRYLDAVTIAYDRLDVIGLTTHHYEPRTTLSVAYLSLTVTAGADRQWRSPDEPSAWQADPRPAENVRVEVALGNGTRTVIRGEAGAGKSTLLRWLAVNASRGGFTQQLGSWNESVPFLVKLRDFADRPLPRGDEFLHQPSSPECGPIPPEWVHRQFAAGTAVLLVDGVDELRSAQRDKVRTWLRGLLGQYPDLSVVVTSRPTAVAPKWLVAEGFQSVELEPMNPADVQVFVERWHRALLDSAPDPDLLPCQPAELPEFERTLMSQLRARANLRALARSPLLCAMLCALNLDRNAKLPRDRVALYSAALDMLLERRDADRGVASATDVSATTAEKIDLLRSLAWWLNENGRQQMSRDEALARLRDRLGGMSAVRLDAETVLKHLVERSGVIREPALGKIDFVHRTFQEFLAAKEAIERDSIDLLVGKARFDYWRETVVMACAHASAIQRGRLLTGILDEADKAGQRTARQLRLLVVICKETATLIEPHEVISRVDTVTRQLVPPRSVRESQSLATAGEPILDYLPKDITGLSTAQAVACVQVAALVNGPIALDLLAGYATDPRGDVQHRLTNLWHYFDPGQYARKVLADAPLPSNRAWQIAVGLPTAIPHLHLLRNLRHCAIALWTELPDSTSYELTKLTQLESLHLNARSMDRLHDWDFLSRLSQLSRLSLPIVTPTKWITRLSNPHGITGAQIRVEAIRDVELIAEQLSSLEDLTLLSLNPMTDLSPLAGLPLRRLILDTFNVDLRTILTLPHLEFLQLPQVHQAGSEPVDISPLADAVLEIEVPDGGAVCGLENMGPGVRLTGAGVKLPR